MTAVSIKRERNVDFLEINIWDPIKKFTKILGRKSNGLIRKVVISGKL